MQKTEQRAAAVAEPRLEFREEPAAQADEKKTTEPTVEEIKARIADKVRADSEEHSRMTPAETVFALIPHSRREGITAILEGIAADDRYKDIKALTTDSGMVFFFSTTHIDAETAVAKSRSEEAKFAIAEKVRADSRNSVKLTRAGDFRVLGPGMKEEEIAGALAEMPEEPGFADIRKVTASTGEVFYHSDRHMSGYYALVLSRVAAKDPCAMIASVVRDESRIYPRPTCVQLFMDKMFEIASCDLKPLVDEMLLKPEFGDIKMIVHPATGGIYLYSSEYMNPHHAWCMVDWQEVGKDANP